MIYFGIVSKTITFNDTFNVNFNSSARRKAHAGIPFSNLSAIYFSRLDKNFFVLTIPLHEPYSQVKVLER